MNIDVWGMDYPYKDDLKVAQEVECMMEVGNCSEETAALVVLISQLKYVAYQVKRLACTVAEWEAEWEEQK